MKNPVKIAAGLFLVVLGAIGLLLPFTPGILFIVLGFELLGIGLLRFSRKQKGK